MHVPDELRYTKDHEWVRREDNRLVVGITDFAQSELGDIVYVDRPALEATIKEGEAAGEIESTKSVSEVYAPAEGRIVAINEEVSEHPELVNSDPYGAGWIFAIEPSDPSAFEAMLSAASYLALVEEQSASS